MGARASSLLPEWRWLILACIGFCLAGAIIVTLLTTPIYRANSTLELNPPSVEVFNHVWPSVNVWYSR